MEMTTLHAVFSVLLGLAAVVAVVVAAIICVAVVRVLKASSGAIEKIRTEEKVMAVLRHGNGERKVIEQ